MQFFPLTSRVSLAGTFTVHGSGRFFENESSSLHEHVRKRSGEEGVGLQAAAYSPPVPKCLVRQVRLVKGLPSGESGARL